MSGGGGGGGGGRTPESADAPEPMVIPATVTRLGASDPSRHGPDLVAVESALAIDLEPADGSRRDRVWTTLRTPGHDEELALGWLWTEGVVCAAADVAAITPCVTAAAEGSRVLRVRLRPGLTVDPERVRRIATATAACGACGRPVDASAAATAAPVETMPAAAREVRMSTAALLAGPEAMRAAQPGFRHSGGLHAAALLEASGRVILVREDVGRHNAVDKVLGAWLGGGRPPGPVALLVSSRAGFEIVQKAAAAAVPIVAAVGAASSLAIEFARSRGLTLAAFVREGRATIYAGEERLVD